MALFAGKPWFRTNIKPYLTKIKAEIAAASGGNPPIITNHSPTDIPVDTATTITVTGDFFTPSTVVTCATGTITNYTFITQQSCTFDLECSTAQTNTIIFAGGGSTTSITIESTVSAWLDLRSTSSDTFTEAHKSGTAMVRDANGVGQTSGALWSHWLKFTSLAWTRSTPKTLSMIMTLGTSAHMAGIQGSDQDGSASAQYYQAEIYAYMPSNYLWGFYGTNAAHSGASNSQTNATLTGYGWYKVVWEHQGEPGTTVKVYGLSDLSDFDGGTLIQTWTVGTAMTANSTTLYPAVTYGNASQRVVAIKLEDV